ncbi:MAG: protein translocase subunit SecF [Anaerolineales bacterium]
MNLIKYRYWYFLISLLVIIPGLFFLILHWVQHPQEGPLKLGIDFTGGALLEVRFDGQRPSIGVVQEIYNAFSTPEETIANPIVQPLGEDAYAIRSKAMSDESRAKIVTELERRSGAKVTVLNFTFVSPVIGQEVTRAAVVAVMMAAVAIMLYIWFAFRQVEHAFRYGTAAIIALLHDVFVVLGVEAILGYFLGWEVDALFLTATLTVIGFSVHDSIVVFDRIRENARIYRRLEYETLVNHSILQTLDRSINTQLTVLFTLTALALFGGESIRHFVIILLLGIFSGTYSSIFNAAPILVVWENREWRNWLRKGQPAAS